jgi:hypothetical protein
MHSINKQIGQNLSHLFRQANPNFKAALHQETMQLFKQQPEDLAQAGHYLRIVDGIHQLLTTVLDQLGTELAANSRHGFVRLTDKWEGVVNHLWLSCEFISDPSKRNEYSLTIKLSELNPEPEPGSRSQLMSLSIPISNHRELEQLRNKLKQISRSDFNRINQFIQKMDHEYCQEVRIPRHERWFKGILDMLAIVALLGLCIAHSALMLNFYVNIFLVYFIGIIYLLNKSEDNCVATLRNKIGYWFTNPAKVHRQSIQASLSSLFNLTAVAPRLHQLKLGITQQELELCLRQSWQNPSCQDFPVYTRNGKTYNLKVIDVISQHTLAEYMQDELRLWEAKKQSAMDMPNVLLYYLPPIGEHHQNDGQFKLLIGDEAMHSFRHNGDFETRRPYAPEQEIYIYAGSELLALLMGQPDTYLDPPLNSSVSQHPDTKVVAYAGSLGLSQR